MIQINTKQALIGISTKNAKLYITQPPADVRMHTEQAKLNMHTEQVQIRIDQQQCFNESGLMSSTALTADIANRGRRNVLEGIGRASSEGDRMSEIENGGNAIAQIAFSNSIDMADYNIVLMPKSKPRIEFIGGTVDIKVDEGYVNTKIKVNKPVIEVEKGSVDIYMRQKPEIDIRYIGDKIDTRI